MFRELDASDRNVGAVCSNEGWNLDNNNPVAKKVQKVPTFNLVQAISATFYNACYSHFKPNQGFSKR